MAESVESIVNPMKNTMLFVAVILMIASLYGCTGRTKASGRVTDSFSMPLENVAITLEHNQNLRGTTVSNNLGHYSISLKEKCFLVCAGGNPSLTFVKQDYETLQTQVDQLGNDCVDVSMRVLGDTTQQSKVAACSN